MNKESGPISNVSPKNSHKVSISLDFRLICILLLFLIIGMLALWRPWEQKATSTARTITVTGEASVKSAPDVFVFSPSYEVTNADKALGSDEVIAKQAEVIAGLKKLGVADSKIKTDTGGYNNSYIDQTTELYHYTTNIQVTIDTDDKAMTQKVQDYLVSTTPTGSISPYSSFSEALRKKLESKGRDVATKDARTKADQSAKNLGFELGGVKSVSDDSGGNGNCLDICTMESPVSMSATTDSKAALTVQAGENEVNYSVTVVYYVK